MSDGELAELFELRPDLVAANPTSFGALAGVVTTPGSASQCLERLDRAARQAVEALCVLGEPARTERLAAALASKPSALEPVLERLAAAALLVRDGDGLVVNPGLRVALRHPARLGRPAAALLGPKTAKELGEVARRLEVSNPGSKHGLIEAMAEALRDPERVAATLVEAPEGTELLARQIAAGRPVVELGYSYAAYERHTSDRTPTGWLLRHGLLIVVSWGVAEMPAEAAISLRGGVIYPNFSPVAPELTLHAIEQVGVDASGAQAALRCVAEVVALVESLGETPAKLLKDGGVGVREVRRLARIAGGDDLATARLLELAALAGLVAVDPHDREVLPTEHFDRFLEASSAERWRTLAEAWLTAPVEPSVAGTEDTEGKPVPAMLVRGPDPGSPTRRRVFAALLTTPPPGQAAGLASLADLADFRAPALYASGPARPTRLVDWQVEESRLLGIAVTPSPGVLAVTSFGRSFLAGDGEAAAVALSAMAPPLVQEIVLQADLTAIAAGELPAALRAELETIADVESSGAATVFRFSEPSLRRGLDAGRSSGEILALLEQHAPRGVPQSLAYLIEDLGRRHGRVRVGSVSSYVRCEDPALVAEMLGARRLNRLGLRSLAPTVLASDVEPDALVEALRQAGYLAAGEEADGTLSVRRPAARRVAVRPGPWAGFGRPSSAAAGGNRHDAGRRRQELLAALRRAAGRGESASPVAGHAAQLGVARAARDGAARRGEGDGGAGSGPGPGRGELLDHRAEAENGDPLDENDEAEHGAGAPAPWRSGRASRQARPSQIAKTPPAVQSLIDLALANGWALRLCYHLDATRGGTYEDYAFPVALRRGMLSLELADGDLETVPIGNVVWARVLTEAEEEANDMTSELY